jgi:aminoglycoside phosphotransferase (APT) family kinase protein
MLGELSAARAPQTAAEELARELERRAAGYFRADGAVRLRRLWKSTRRNATLFGFEARVNGSSRRLVVKLPRGRNQAHGPRTGSRRALPDALRVLPVSSEDQRSDREHTTLAWLHEHFAGLGDPRFGAIRVLDYLPEQRALVMEHCPDRNLADLLSRRFGPLGRLAASVPGPALRNVGAWLRAFHELPAAAGSRERVSQRSEFLASIDRMLDYLREDAADAVRLEAVRAEIRARAREALPEQLPLVTAHGDFVPRNVLVAPGGRVTVFDTRAQWRAPRYEDLARFRVALSASDLQLATPDWLCDRELPARCAAELLAGYFADETPPLCAIRLFECQRLLALRVAATHQRRIATGARRGAKAIALGLRTRYVTRQLDSLLGEDRGGD